MSGEEFDRDARERARARLRERAERHRAEQEAERHGRGGQPADASARGERGHGASAGQQTAAQQVLAVASRGVSAVRDAVRGRERMALAALGAVIVLIIVLVAVRGCVSGSRAQDASDSAAQTTDEQPQEQVQEQRDPLDMTTLQGILGTDLAQQLATASEDNADVNWIAAHPDQFAVDGDDVQRKLLKLATVEPSAVPFVRGFPDTYPMKQASAGTDSHDEGTVPRLYQWDERWGYTVYSGTAFALTGCAPTSFAMVYQGLTGKSDLSPYDMGQISDRDGFMTAFDGTDASLFAAESPSLGLVEQPISVDAYSLKAALESGQLVICNVGPGDFTEGGHFFVITGVDEEGKLIINDPFSVIRSEEHWDVDTVLNQTIALYGFSAQS